MTRQCLASGAWSVFGSFDLRTTYGRELCWAPEDVFPCLIHTYWKRLLLLADEGNMRAGALYTFHVSPSSLDWLTVLLWFCVFCGAVVFVCLFFRSIQSQEHLVYYGFVGARKTAMVVTMSAATGQKKSLTQIHQDLGWLSCLRSPTFRHAVDRLVIRVSLDISASICVGASYLTIECALLSQVSRTQWLLCVDPPSLLVRRRWLDSGMVLSSLTHSTTEN